MTHAQGTPRLVIKLKVPPDGTHAQSTAVDEVDTWLHKGRTDGNESASSSSDTSTPPTSNDTKPADPTKQDTAETVSEDAVELARGETATSQPPPKKKRKGTSKQDTKVEEGESNDKRPLMPFELVWAKLPSFPWWPAQIAEPQEHQRKKRHKKDDYFVVFYGENNWAWIERQKLAPYTENYAKYSANKNKGLQHAIQLANQSIVS